MRYPRPRLVDLRYFYDSLRGHMTYIIAGKLKGNPFLMVDCIAYNSDLSDMHSPRLLFSNKLMKFRSLKDTYCCLTGDAKIMDSIELFDRKNHFNKTEINYDSQNFIDEVFVFYKHLINKSKVEKLHGDARIFVVDSEKIIHYDLKYDKKANLTTCNKSYVNDGCFVASIEGEFRPDTLIPENIGDLYKYCGTYINQNSPLKHKNRFSFVTYENGASNYKSPYKKDEDMVTEFLWTDFNKL